MIHASQVTLETAVKGVRTLDGCKAAYKRNKHMCGSYDYSPSDRSCKLSPLPAKSNPGVVASVLGQIAIGGGSDWCSLCRDFCRSSSAVVGGR